MRKYCLKRLRTLLPTLFMISVILFGLVKMMPADPVALMMDPHTKPELYAASYEAKKEELGYNDAIPVQYLHYLANLVHGDFGYSSTYQLPVRDVITEPLKNTIVLNGFVLLLSILIAVPLGTYCAYRKNRILDHCIQYASIAGISMPSFLFGVCLLYVFSLKWHLIPIGGVHTASWSDSLLNMFLPIVTLSVLMVCGLVRYVRNAMVEALAEDYIFALKSRGISRFRILFVHALRNAILPIMSVVIFRDT